MAIDIEFYEIEVPHEFFLNIDIIFIKQDNDAMLKSTLLKEIF